LIKLEFQTESSIVSDTRSTLLLSMSAEMIETTCFYLPVRFKVGEVDLFENISYDRTVFVCHVERDMLEGTENSEERNPWISIPLLHITSAGFRQVRKACLGESVFYHLPGGGYLQIHPIGEKVEITSSLSQRSVNVSCSELLEAFEDFSERVCRFIIQEVPELQDHPAWPTWFKDKE
jgi:hypothetical protein